MPKLKAGTISPTEGEGEAIRAAAATDPDNPIWTEADHARARPASKVLAPAVYAAATAKRPPGRPKADRTKELVSIRYDAEALARWRATGPGWQTRLAEWVARGPAAVPG